MKIKTPSQPTYWLCPVCGKWDDPKVTVAMATPEHVPYRGIDIGSCAGIMICLYSEKDIQKANE